MREKIRRITASILVLSMLLSLFNFSAIAATEDAQTTANVSTNDVSVTGSNAVGTLVADAISDKEAENAKNNEAACAITDLTVSNNTATVEFSTDQSSDLVVAIYDEVSEKMTASGTDTVTNEQETVSITLEGDMPTYFTATAYMLNSDTYEPLCKEYTTDLYTEEAQTIIQSTIDDYDADKVLNLDDDKTTNFVVYNDSTIQIDSTSQENVLTHTESDGTYTISNPTSEMLALKIGDTLSYPQDDGTLILIKVKDVSVNDGIVHIVEDTDVGLTDFFDTVKIEGGYGMDNSNPSTQNFDEREDLKYEKNFDISQEYKNYDEDNPFDDDKEVKTNIKFSANGKLIFDGYVKVYADRKWQYVELKIVVQINGKLSAEGKVNVSKPLFSDEVGFSPVAGVYVTFTPTLITIISGAIEAGFDFETELGYGWDSNNGYSNKNKDPKLTAQIKAKVTLSIGLSLEPKVKILDDNIASLSLSAEVIARMDLTASHTLGDGIVHECAVCVEGELYVDLNVSATIKILSKLKHLGVDSKIDLINKNWKIGDFHYSADYDEWSLSPCQHKRYRVKLRIINQDGTPVANTDVKYVVKTGLLNNTTLYDCKLKTNDDGYLDLGASYYLRQGSYLITLENEDFSQDVKVDIEDNEVSKDVVAYYMWSKEQGSITASGTCGANLTWRLYDSGKLYITGIGETYNYSYVNDAPWITYTDKLKSVIIGYGVTSIGERAFCGCSSLSSIEIPSSVTSIGELAFKGCSSLSSIEIPSSVTSIGDMAFDGCSNLSSIEIPSSVTSIGDYAFHYCSSLNSIEIPSSVTSIGTSAFGGCSSLNSIKVDAKNTAYDSRDNCNAIIHTKSNTLLRGCKDTTIPSSVTSIGEQAFFGCSSLRSITIPSSVTSIESYAFCCCSSLNSIEIPSSVTSIESGAFDGCSSLRSIEIPSSVTSIGGYAFDGCSSLSSIEIPSSVTSIGDYAFYGCSSLSSIEIPSSVTSIGEHAFSGCRSLSSITIPSSVTSIGSGAFYYCSSLKSITIPSSVTSIGDSAFRGCDRMGSITIPSSVTSIGNSAFYGCSSLTDVFYTGSQSEWNNISIGSWNYYLEEANIHYNSGISVASTDDEQSDEIDIADEGDISVTAEQNCDSSYDVVEPLDAVRKDLSVDRLMGNSGSVALLKAYSTVPSMSGTTNVASFTGLLPNSDYVLLVVKDENAEDLLDASKFALYRSGNSR